MIRAFKRGIGFIAAIAVFVMWSWFCPQWGVTICSSMHRTPAAVYR